MYPLVQFETSSECGSILDENYEEIIKTFKSEWNLLKEEFQVSKTLKVHIMEDHIGQYIKDTGKPLGKSSDETVESCHQWLNKRLVSSGYLTKDIMSDENGERLHKEGHPIKN